MIFGQGSAPVAGCRDPSRFRPRQRFSPQALPSLLARLHLGHRSWQPSSVLRMRVQGSPGRFIPDFGSYNDRGICCVDAGFPNRRRPRWLLQIYLSVVGGNRSEHFRCCFAMGKIRGTPRIRSHISVHRTTTKYFLTRLFSKMRLKRKERQEILRQPWAQEVPSSNLGAPIKIPRVFSLAYQTTSSPQTAVWNSRRQEV